MILRINKNTIKPKNMATLILHATYIQTPLCCWLKHIFVCFLTFIVMLKTKESWYGFQGSIFKHPDYLILKKNNLMELIFKQCSQISNAPSLLCNHFKYLSETHASWNPLLQTIMEWIWTLSPLHFLTLDQWVQEGGKAIVVKASCCLLMSCFVVPLGKIAYIKFNQLCCYSTWVYMTKKWKCTIIKSMNKSKIPKNACG